MAKQKGFFDEDFRLEKIRRQGDPLLRLKDLINWEMFRPVLFEAFMKEAKGPGGAGCAARWPNRAARRESIVVI